MRVILNGISTLKPKTGVGHTTANLYRSLIELGSGDAFWLYPGKTISGAVRRVLSGKPVGAGGQGGTPTGLPLNRQSILSLAKAACREHFRFAARWHRFDLYHEPNFVPVSTNLPTVITVHDLSVIMHPEWHPTDRVAFHERHFHRGIAAADHVIVVSESVRREVLDTLGLKPDRVTAIPNGIGEQFYPRNADEVIRAQTRLGLPTRYLLAVGTIEPRKNILMLLRAYCDLPGELRQSCPLVLAGGWGWKSEPERKTFEEVARHRGVIHLGYVDDRDLPALYTGARALLFPSFYEGFGLPPVEMLACGGNVIASAIDVVREVVGSHAKLIDPNDLESWREAMRTAIAEPDLLVEAKHMSVSLARIYTWEAAARRTLGVYHEVLGTTEVKKPVPSYFAA